MSKREVFSWANSATYRMRVRGTNQGPGRFDNGIIWTSVRDRFLHEPHLPYSFHYKCFHFLSFLSCANALLTIGASFVTRHAQSAPLTGICGKNVLKNQRAPMGTPIHPTY